MKRDQAEFRLHCWVADYLRKTAWPSVLWFHPANGENRSKITGGRLKRMGVLRGTPDFVFITPLSTCFLELKRPGGRLSPEQKAFRDKVTGLGCPYKVATTGDEARAILSDWKVTRETYKRGSAIVGEIVHGDLPL